MLLREYKDRNGIPFILNLENISVVQPECSEELWNGVGMPLEDYDNMPVTVYFGSIAFLTTRKVYMEMIGELQQPQRECRCFEAKCDDTEVRPSISMYHVKHQIMKADYMSSDTKIRLLADLDIVL